MFYNNGQGFYFISGGKRGKCIFLFWFIFFYILDVVLLVQKVYFNLLVFCSMLPILMILPLSVYKMTENIYCCEIVKSWPKKEILAWPTLMWSFGDKVFNHWTVKHWLMLIMNTFSGNSMRNKWKALNFCFSNIRKIS